MTNKPQTTSQDDIARPPPEESEFGKGYAYCLGLFLAHEWKSFEMRQKDELNRAPHVTDHFRFERPEMWFYGAADHLFELEAPPSFTEEEKKALDEWKTKCRKFRMASYEGLQCTWQDVKDACDEAKRRLLEWDLRNGIAAIKGGWQ